MKFLYPQSKLFIKKKNENIIQIHDLYFRYNRLTPQNRNEYVRLALNYRLHEFDEQVKAVRDGMSKVVPVPLLSLFSASQLQVF